ncbi:hypothetical protein PAPHI01_0335 [Pancytospora philotis]|nr:hypothetical protein PAPHI01_0335 [Pancytospora philotis]
MIFAAGTLLLGQCLCSWAQYQHSDEEAKPHGDADWECDIDAKELDRALSDHGVRDNVSFSQSEEPSLRSLLNNCQKYVSMDRGQAVIKQFMKNQANSACADMAKCIELSVLNEQFAGWFIEKITEKKFSLLVVLRKILKHCNALDEAASALACVNQLYNGGTFSNNKTLIYARKYMAAAFVDRVIEAELAMDPATYLYAKASENDLGDFIVYLQVKCFNNNSALKWAVTSILRAALDKSKFLVYLDSFTIPFIEFILSRPRDSDSPFYSLKGTVTGILLSHSHQNGVYSASMSRFRYIWMACASYQVMHWETQKEGLFGRYVYVLSSCYENTDVYFKWAHDMLQVLSNSEEFSAASLREVLKDSEALSKLPISCVLLFVAQVVPKHSKRQRYAVTGSVMCAMASHQIIALLEFIEYGGCSLVPIEDFVGAMDDKQRTKVAEWIAQRARSVSNPARLEALGRIKDHLRNGGASDEDKNPKQE